MACSFCGGQNCVGYCLNSGIQGNCVINQQTYGNFIPTVGVAGQGVQVQGGLQGQGQLVWGGFPTLDTSLHNFLDIIADRSDTDACVAFIEQQLSIRANQIKEIERLQKQYQDDLDKSEKEFLEKCRKYRPTIDSEVMKRVKGLKAFY